MITFFEFIDSIPINNADIYHYSIKTPEICYLNLLENILSKGNTRTDRTQIGTISNFGNFIEFDIRNCIPLLTTKKVAWKTCIKELLWFLKGSTDANLLKKENVNIWNGNSSREFLDNRGLVHYKEGDIGPLYGFSWRHFGANYINCDTDYSGQGFDQIKYIENELINNHTSRRIYLSAWNPCDMNKCAIMPCHVSIQFYVEDNMLSSHVYMRSADTFLGLPFNIFSYAVLTYLFAKKTKLIPNKMCFSIGDAHIYSNHLDQVKMLLNRKPFGLPQLEINDNVINKDWNEITLDDFNLKNYVAHPSIKAEMAV
jgi:thymidylate synthase